MPKRDGKERMRKMTRAIEREREDRNEGADNGSGQQNEYRHALFFPDL